MRKFIYTLPIVAVLILFQCSESVLDDKTPALPTEQGAFFSESEIETGIYGVYSKLVFYHNYVENTIAMLHGVRLFPDDDLTVEGNLHSFDFFSGITPDEWRIESYYRVTNELVGRANGIIDVIANRDDVYTTPGLQEAHLGEVLFLRAYGYYILWSYWENAPLVTERIRAIEDAQVPNSSGTALLDQAIEDLRQAAAGLENFGLNGPTSWDEDQRGRVTAGSARGLLAKILITRGDVTGSNQDYVSAIDEINRVTAYGYRLMDDYSDNFRPGTENNEESLFEIQLGKSTGAETNFWLNTDNFGGDGDTSGFWGFFTGAATIWGAPIWIPTFSFHAAFSPDDPRREYNINEDGSRVTKYVFDVEGAIEVNEDWGEQYPALGGYYNNSRVLRYADLLLLKAEAILASGGNTGEAISLINNIRTRARNMGNTNEPADRDVSESNTNLIFQWLMEERRLELAYEEGIRWLDLRRWHKAGKINLNNWDFSSANPALEFTERNLNLPFPSRERERNLSLSQSPGWEGL